MVDILASRYGWTKEYIEKGLYWEELWELIQVASNLAAEEKNEEWKLHFMLHMDTKKSKWKDLPIPFPTTGPQRIAVPGDVGGVKQLQHLFPGFSVKMEKASETSQKENNARNQST